MRGLAGEIASRAAHTFWQSFTGLMGAWWTASGLDLVHQVTNVSTADRFATGALAAVAASAASAVKTTLATGLSDPVRVDNRDGSAAAANAALDAALAELDASPIPKTPAAAPATITAEPTAT
jgi:hypothetical protein